MAGAEQVGQFLLEAATPDALAHLLRALEHVHESGLGAVAVDAAQGAAAYVMEHGVALDHMASHLGQAVGEVGQAFDPASAHGFHFPVVTMLMSGMREAQLVLEQKTSLERALAHVALDTGATAAGAAAGAKLGAVVGSFIAPGLGTALGGFIGGALGGMGGRKVATHVKMAPLNSALEALRIEHASMTEALRVSARSACSAVQEECARGRGRMAAAIQRAPSVRGALSVQGAADAASALAGAMVESVESSRRATAIAVSEVRNTLPRPKFGARILGLDTNGEAGALLDLQLSRSDAYHDGLVQAVGHAAAQANVMERLEALASIEVKGSPGICISANACTKAIDAAYRAGAAARDVWCGTLASTHKDVCKSILAAGEAAAKRHGETLTHWRPRVEDKTRLVEAQRAALGAA